MSGAGERSLLAGGVCWRRRQMSQKAPKLPARAAPAPPEFSSLKVATEPVGTGLWHKASRLRRFHLRLARLEHPIHILHGLRSTRRRVRGTCALSHSHSPPHQAQVLESIYPTELTSASLLASILFPSKAETHAKNCRKGKSASMSNQTSL